MSVFDHVFGYIASALNPIPYLQPQYCGEGFNWKDYVLASVKQEEKSFYFLVGGILIKVLLLAKKYEITDRGYIICRIVEIDGKVISEQISKKNEQKIEIQVGEPSDPKKPERMLRDALKAFGIKGRIAPVSDSYVGGHLKRLQLLARISQNKEAR